MSNPTPVPGAGQPGAQPTLEELYRLKGELVTALEIAQMRLNQVNQQLQPRLGIIPIQPGAPVQNG